MAQWWVDEYFTLMLSGLSHFNVWCKYWVGNPTCKIFQIKIAVLPIIPCHLTGSWNLARKSEVYHFPGWPFQTMIKFTRKWPRLIQYIRTFKLSELKSLLRLLNKAKTWPRIHLTFDLALLGVLENLARLAAALLELNAGVVGVLGVTGVLGVAGVRAESGVLESADPWLERGLLFGVLGDSFSSSTPDSPELSCSSTSSSGL